MTVGIRDLRRNLSSYLERVQSGEEVVVTDRGKVIARVVPINWTSRRDELIARGLITPASRPWSPIDLGSLVELDEPLSAEIVRQRGPD